MFLQRKPDYPEVRNSAISLEFSSIPNCFPPEVPVKLPSSLCGQSPTSGGTFMKDADGLSSETERPNLPKNAIDQMFYRIYFPSVRRHRLYGTG